MDERARVADDRRATRRDALLLAGGALAALAGAASRAGAASAPAACVLTPEQAEGPYFLPDHRLRRDIRGGRPGVRLDLRTTIVDASTCRPLAGAVVDVWHCDGLGVYSGVDGQSAAGARFCRGVQRTDARGLARFTTIYPGWYPGRTVHIHVKVGAGGDQLHTGQLYFPDRVTDAVYRSAPYRSRPGRDTRNAADRIYADGGARSTLRVRPLGQSYVASIVLGVLRA